LALSVFYNHLNDLLNIKQESFKLASTKVDSGICGFQTEIEAQCNDFQHVDFKINSTCKNITELANELPQVDAFNEIKSGYDGEIYTKAKKVQKSNCAGCVVPPAIFKTMQVAANLALPKDAKIEIKK